MSRPSRQWFPRFGDVPGIEWTTPPGIDRAHLQGHDAVPEQWDGSGDSVWWPIVYSETREEMEGGSTSASPAAQYPTPETDRTVAEELQRLGEALELPGEPATYHYLIAGAAEYLFSIRRREPVALREVERLSLLDIDLLRARPDILTRHLRPGEDFTLVVGVLPLLYRLYMDSGELEEAEQVAAMAVDEFKQRFDRQLTETRQRLATLQAEGV